jgi:hypothetical protein
MSWVMANDARLRLARLQIVRRKPRPKKASPWTTTVPRPVQSRATGIMPAFQKRSVRRSVDRYKEQSRDRIGTDRDTAMARLAPSRLSGTWNHKARMLRLDVTHEHSLELREASARGRLQHDRPAKIAVTIGTVRFADHSPDTVIVENLIIAGDPRRVGTVLHCDLKSVADDGFQIAGKLAAVLTISDVERSFNIGAQTFLRRVLEADDPAEPLP